MPAQGQQLSPDIKRAIEVQGYVGRSTLSPPREEFRRELMSFNDTGAPLHGAGAFTAATHPAGLPGPMAGPQSTMVADAASGAWHNRLPPDMRRAGPEIYRSLRSAGSRSVREWINVQYTGHRAGDQFTDLWTLASSVDMVLGRCVSDAEIMQLLSSDDQMEIALRRLASYVYEARTQDRSGARAMLAVLPAGGNNDIAPTWLVSEAAVRSRNEYQTAERVSRGRGRGRGRGGHDGTSDYTPSGDAGRGRGRARGRGEGRDRPPEGGK